MMKTNSTARKPFYTILMPTRNRAHLLRSALRCAFAQTYDDFEIIVSDNDSSDNTPQTVQEFAHPRLRYVRTPKSMNMPDHWEWAVEHAKGEYITFLCDDDAMSPVALATVAETIEKHKTQLVMMGGTAYFGANSIDEGCRNGIMVPLFRGGVEIMDSATVMHQMEKFVPQPLFLPRMLNSFVHRDLFHSVRKEASRVFHYSPDYSFALLMQSSTPNWAYIHEPLWSAGCFAESIGMSGSQNRGEAAKVFYNEMGPELFRNGLLTNYIVTNVLANTYLECQKLLPQKLANFKIDMVGYFESAWKDMIVLEGYGVDIRDDIETFEKGLATQPEEIRRQVRSKIRAFPLRVGRYFGYRIPNSRFLIRIGTRFMYKSRFYWGDERGFADIFEASQMLPKVGPHVQSAAA